MFILNGRKMINAILVAFILILVGIIILTGKNDSENYIDTVSLPVSGKTVVIDARTRCSRRTVLSLLMEQQKHKQI